MTGAWDSPAVRAAVWKVVRQSPEWEDDEMHDARPDDLPEAGDRCKDCGEAVTWVGPGHLDWAHVETEAGQ